MQLEELQTAWQGLDQKLDRAIALQAELVRQAVAKTAHGSSNRLVFWPAVDICLCVGAFVFCVAYLNAHWGQWPVMLPAAILAAGAVALLAGSVRQLEIVLPLDWTRPVAEIQTSLGKLRLAKIRQFKWLMLLAPLMGFCAFIAGLHWTLECMTEGRVNVLDHFNAWIVSNYVFGVLFVPLGYLAARILAKQCHRHAWWQSLLNDISGKTLYAATQELDRWATLQLESTDRQR